MEQRLSASQVSLILRNAKVYYRVYKNCPYAFRLGNSFCGAPCCLHRQDLDDQNPYEHRYETRKGFLCLPLHPGCDVTSECAVAMVGLTFLSGQMAENHSHPDKWRRCLGIFSPSVSCIRLYDIRRNFTNCVFQNIPDSDMFLE